MITLLIILCLMAGIFMLVGGLAWADGNDKLAVVTTIGFVASAAATIVVASMIV